MRIYDIYIQNISSNDFPYFLTFDLEYPLSADDFSNDDLDRKKPWYYYNEEVPRSIKEIRDTEKEMKKSLKIKFNSRENEANEYYPELSKTNKQKKLWEQRFNKFEWQNKLRSTKYVNNVDYVFNKTFSNLINKCNLGDLPDQELSKLFLKSATVVSERLVSIIERYAKKSEIKFELHENWEEGQKIISKWLIEDITEFNILKRSNKAKNNLHQKLLSTIGKEKIVDNKNRIGEFAHKIFLSKKLKKVNGSYYTESAIRRELYTILMESEI